MSLYARCDICQIYTNDLVGHRRMCLIERDRRERAYYPDLWEQADEIQRDIEAAKVRADLWELLQELS